MKNLVLRSEVIGAGMTAAGKFGNHPMFPERVVLPTQHYGRRTDSDNAEPAAYASAGRLYLEVSTSLEPGNPTSDKLGPGVAVVESSGEVRITYLAVHRDYEAGSITEICGDGTVIGELHKGTGNDFSSIRCRWRMSDPNNVELLEDKPAESELVLARAGNIAVRRGYFHPIVGRSLGPKIDCPEAYRYSLNGHDIHAVSAEGWYGLDDHPSVPLIGWLGAKEIEPVEYFLRRNGITLKDITSIRTLVCRGNCLHLVCHIKTDLFVVVSVPNPLMPNSHIRFQEAIDQFV